MPPPPVSGAAVGKGVELAEWVADGVRAEFVSVADPEAEAEVLGAVEAGADVCVAPEAEAPAELDLPAAGLLVDELLVARLLVAPLLVAWLLAAGCVAEDRAPVGEGVRVARVADPDEEVSGVGVKVDGTEEPLAVQAETASPSSTAPAARRPAVSHASRVAAGVLSRIFMDPPRTRVRCTR